MDLETLLSPGQPRRPCGVDLEYDASFAEIDRLSQGKPEQQIGEHHRPRRGAGLEDAPEEGARSFSHVARTCGSAAHLTRALLRNSGWSGLAHRARRSARSRRDATGTVSIRAWIPTDDNDPDHAGQYLHQLLGYADAERGAGDANRLVARARPLLAARLEIASGDVPAPPPPRGAAPPTDGDHRRRRDGRRPGRARRDRRRRCTPASSR